jgi:signal transduction histidine kinase
VLSRKKIFRKRELAILQLFGPLATLAIRKAQLYDELDKALKTRDLFISMASHELRTPLTTAYTYLQLQKRRVEKGGKIEKDWIEITINELLRLNNLVDGLLQLNQVKEGKIGYNFIEVNLKDVILTSLRSFKALHKRRQIDLQDNTNEKDMILGDFEKLIQVFVNILDNAAKHSPSNSVISIRLSSSRKNVVAEIEDRGTGFAKKDLKKIFDAFYKVENNTKAGMGLGLYLTKQILDDHRSKISIEPILHKGTIVKIQFSKIKYD